MTSERAPLEILTTNEGAKLLRMSPAKLRDLASAGAVAAFRIGPRWRFRRQDLISWVEQEARRNVGPEVCDLDGAE